MLKAKKNTLFALIALLIAATFVTTKNTQTPTKPKINLAAIQGDVNNDGRVDVLDFQLLSNSFGRSQGQTGFNSNADINTDTRVDILDFQLLSNNFGRTGGTSTPTQPAPTSQPGSVDASTMNRKFMFGYQGWFQTPCDGSPSPAWRHWFSGSPSSANVLIDQWPDVSEHNTSEMCSTGFRYPNGQTAYLFSAYTPSIVMKHFQWMQQYGIDGVMLQRFGNEISPNSGIFQIRNKVTDNVRAGAEATGRVWNIMYDITGTPGNVATTLINDWKYLVDQKRVTSSPRYLKQNGLPVVVIWGFGFSDRPGTPTDLQNVLNFFHNDPNPAYRAFVMGGVNNDWRTNGTWASSFKGTSARKGFDAISPWMVGRIRDINGANNYRSTWAAEIAYANQAPTQLFMPVVFPGFSFFNQSGSGLNQIPRLGGRFVWAQGYNALSAGATMLYGAMFDEVNEGTAFFKMAPTSAGWPSGFTMVPLNTDGYSQIPSDWYLRVGGEISKMVRGQIPLSPNMSITPQ